MPPPGREALLAGLLDRIRDVVPGWRLLARDILGNESRIDFVGTEPAGRVVVVLAGEPGEDLALVARGLAQGAWVEARLGDWAQLAPDRGLRVDRGVRIQLLCPQFGAEALAAARAVGTERMGLARYRFVRNGAGAEPLLEFLFDDGADEPLPEPARRPRDEADAPASPFRSGLTDADLGLTPEEQSELD
jgi:hypothetical protein